MHRQTTRFYTKKATAIILMIIFLGELLCLMVLFDLKSETKKDKLYSPQTKNQIPVKSTNVDFFYPCKLGKIKVCIDKNFKPYTQIVEDKFDYTLFSEIVIVLLIKSIGLFLWINQFRRQLSEKLKVQTSDFFRRRTKSVDNVKFKKRIERELFNSEQHYRSLVETTNEGIFVTQGGCTKYVNSTMLNITAYTEVELLTAKSLELIHPDDKNLVISNYHKRIKGEKVDQRYLCRILKKDGSIRWVEISGTKIEWEGASAILNVLTDITERKQIEQQLLESESKFREMANLLPQIVFELDEDGRLTYINEHAYLILGYDKSEIKLGEKTHFFHIPEERQKMTEGVQSVLDGVLPIRALEYTLVCKDGSLLNTLIYVNPIFRNNKRIGVRGVIADITRLKQAEQGLRESEQRYRLLVETANEGIMVVKDGYVEFLNSMLLKITSYSRDELMSIPFLTIVHSEDKEHVKSYYANILNACEFESRCQFRIYGKDKRVKWVEMNAALIEWQGETAILNLVDDITERKQTESALVESEKNLAKAQQIALIGSWSLNMQTNTFTCTKEFRNIFNVDSSIFNPELDSLIHIIHQEDIQIFKNTMNPHYLIENLSPMEYRVIQPNGTVRIIYAEVRFDFDLLGKPIRCMGITQDITELKKAEEERKSLEQMRDYMQYTTKAVEKERLTISRELHDDLGQALTAIKMDLEVLKGHASHDHDIVFSSKVSKIACSVIETIKTVQHLTEKLRPEIIDDLGLNAAIEWYTDEFAQRYGIKIILETDNGVEISADISLTIFRILQESLTNIARYSKATQVQIRISYICSNVHFEIFDNGIGISDEQIKSKNSFGIWGMTERVQSLGGSFAITSKKRGGTEIRVEIPIISDNKNEIDY